MIWHGKEIGAQGLRIERVGLRRQLTHEERKLLLLNTVRNKNRTEEGINEHY